jgi:hypothetical protein
LFAWVEMIEGTLHCHCARSGAIAPVDACVLCPQAEPAAAISQKFAFLFSFRKGRVKNGGRICVAVTGVCERSRLNCPVLPLPVPAAVLPIGAIVPC